MNINYYGLSCFKITTKPGGRATEDVVIFLAPFDKSIGLRPPQGHADLVFTSDNNEESVAIEKKLMLRDDPVIINIPGEYSIRGINIIGIDSENNNIFLLETEDIRLCHLGDLKQDLNADQLKHLNKVDILFIPVGGGNTIDGKQATEIAKKIEPHLIIPMHYKMRGLNTKEKLEDESEFCSNIGNCPDEKVGKINLKKKDLSDKSMEVVLMKIE